MEVLVWIYILSIAMFISFAFSKIEDDDKFEWIFIWGIIVVSLIPLVNTFCLFLCLYMSMSTERPTSEVEGSYD